MNAYDFDNTVFRGDSTAKFYVYCLLRTPKMILRLPKLLFGAVFVLPKDKQRFKQGMFAFLRDLADPEKAVSEFWDRKLGGIKRFYLAGKKEDDVIISASPEFLVKPAMARLGVSGVLASPVDIRTGRYRGLNCHGEEKVRRFRAVFPAARVETFYSDSRSDAPMARLAERAYLVKGEKLIPWEDQPS